MKKFSNFFLFVFFIINIALNTYYFIMNKLNYYIFSDILESRILLSLFPLLLFPVLLSILIRENLFVYKSAIFLVLLINTSINMNFLVMNNFIITYETQHNIYVTNWLISILILSSCILSPCIVRFFYKSYSSKENFLDLFFKIFYIIFCSSYILFTFIKGGFEIFLSILPPL